MSWPFDERNSGALRPFSSSNFNCCSIFQHFLFDKTIIKKWRVFGGFSKFNENQNFWRQLFIVLSIHKPLLMSCEVIHKIFTISVQLFWRLLDRNRHAKYIFMKMKGLKHQGYKVKELEILEFEESAQHVNTFKLKSRSSSPLAL